jgi:predicted nucleic acid-binding protein
LIAFDTNVLIYASERNEPMGRNIKAIDLLTKVAPLRAVIPLQVVGEYINACRRKKITSLPDASIRASFWMELYNTPSSQPDDYIEAARFSAEFGLQYFDALIIAVATRAGATMLLSEDMHDGLEVDGLRVVNPFVPENDAVLAEYFAAWA